MKTSLVVPAGGDLVLGRSTDITVNGGTPVAYGYGNGFVLSNDTDRIVLRDRYDQPIDEVRWAQGDGFPRPNGASVARTVDGWCVSGPQFGIGDLGTPGVANDCTPLPHVDVVISEINTDPDAVSDTVGEWIEITNRLGGEPSTCRAGVSATTTSTCTRSPSSLVVAPGDSVVLGRDLSAALNGGAPVDYSYGTAFPLTNDEDEITLARRVARVGRPGHLDGRSPSARGGRRLGRARRPRRRQQRSRQLVHRRPPPSAPSASSAPRARRTTAR